MNKYIIFGAGNFGKSALKYYGKDNVLFFVDNNPAKQGSEFCGKDVIGFDELLTRQHEGTIVVATAGTESIRKQLEENEIKKYRCYTPSFEHAMDYMRNNLSNKKWGDIALYGINGDTEQIIEVLETLGLKDNIKYIIRSDYKESMVNLGKYQVVDSLDIFLKKYESDCFIVSSPINHLALRARLRQQIKDKAVLDPFLQNAYYDMDDIVFNPYLAQAEEKDESKWNEAVIKDETKAAVRAYVDVMRNKQLLFEYIEIETINRCNGVCSFCPVNKNIDPRSEKKMEMSLFKKIIDELREIGYSGELSLFSNNEPLLDDRIIELHKYARENLPEARMHLFTNGTLMTIDIFKELIKYLDELIIDNYMQELQLIKPVREIRDYVEEHPELRKKVTIVLRKQREILTSRGGDAPNRKEKVSFEGETCALPFEQMIIRPDGKVSLCCNDPLGKNTLGDVSKDTLLDVWFGDKYLKLRESIAIGREQWEHCKYCDTFYLY